MSYNQELAQAIDNNSTGAVWELIYDNPAFVKCDIPFDPEWNNGTGYFNGAVKADIPQLEVGEIGRSRSPTPNNRRLLIVKTPFGNVVLFERFTPTEEKPIGLPITFNMPEEVRVSEMLGTEGAMDVEQLTSALGDNLRQNIGARLAHFMRIAKYGRGTKRLRFSQTEARLVAATNVHKVIDIMLNNVMEEDAIAELMKQSFVTPPVVRETHVNHSIPYHSDGTGVQASHDDVYKFTELQAKLVLKMEIGELIDSKRDQLLGEYAKLASEILFAPVAPTAVA